MTSYEKLEGLKGELARTSQHISSMVINLQGIAQEVEDEKKRYLKLSAECEEEKGKGRKEFEERVKEMMEERRRIGDVEAGLEKDRSALERDRYALERERSAFEKEKSAFEKEKSNFEKEKKAFEEKAALQAKAPPPSPFPQYSQPPSPSPSQDASARKTPTTHTLKNRRLVNYGQLQHNFTCGFKGWIGPLKFINQTDYVVCGQPKAGHFGLYIHKLSESRKYEKQEVLKGLAENTTIYSLDTTPDYLMAGGKEKIWMYNHATEAFSSISYDLGKNANVVSMKVSEDKFFTASDLKEASLWDSRKSCRLHKFAHPGNILSLDYHSNQLVTATEKVISLWDIRSKSLIKQIDQEVPINDIRFENEGTLIYGGEDGRIVKWDISSQKVTYQVNNSGTAVLKLSFCEVGSSSYFGNTVIAALDNMEKGEIALWNVEEGTEIQRLKGHQNIVSGLDAKGDGLLSISHDGNIIYWRSNR